MGYAGELNRNSLEVLYAAPYACLRDSEYLDETNQILRLNCSKDKNPQLNHNSYQLTELNYARCGKNATEELDQDGKLICMPPGNYRTLQLRDAIQYYANKATWAERLLSDPRASSWKNVINDKFCVDIKWNQGSGELSARCYVLKMVDWTERGHRWNTSLTYSKCPKDALVEVDVAMGVLTCWGK